MKRGTVRVGCTACTAALKRSRWPTCRMRLARARDLDEALRLRPWSRSSASRPARLRRLRETPWQLRNARGSGVTMLTASTCPRAHGNRHAPRPQVPRPPPRAPPRTDRQCPPDCEFGRAGVFLRVKSAQVADADHGRAHQGGASRRHLLRGAILLAHLQSGAADDRERGAGKTQEPRHTVHSPADSDHSIAPDAPISRPPR